MSPPFHEGAVFAGDLVGQPRYQPGNLLLDAGIDTAGAGFVQPHAIGRIALVHGVAVPLVVLWTAQSEARAVKLTIAVHNIRLRGYKVKLLVLTIVPGSGGFHWDSSDFGDNLTPLFRLT